MAKYLIDENLPYSFSLWNHTDFIHVFDLNKSLTDEKIWEMAKTENLTIITKDADFSNKILFHTPPPKVIHLRIGNMRIKDLHNFLNTNWKRIISVSEKHKLTNVYSDRIEGIE